MLLDLGCYLPLDRCLQIVRGDNRCALDSRSCRISVFRESTYRLPSKSGALIETQPGAIYLLSMWYTRRELALRVGIFYCGSITSNGWGSLIAAGILSRFRTWPQLFYVEGGITIGLGLLAA